MFPGVVGAADEGTGFDVAEAELEGVVLEGGEFLRRDVAGDDQLFGRRPQVLSESENVAAVLAQIAKDFEQFLAGLPQPEHETRLREDVGTKFSCHFQHAQGTLVHRAGPDLFVQARDGFHVMGEHGERRFHNALDAGGYAAEIGDEHFEFA